MNADAVLRELAGLRALARSLVHGDADAEDLLQDTAIAALEHPPRDPRGARPWLSVVLRNRWKMDRRAASRRVAREDVPVEGVVEQPDAALDRARTLERLATALVGLAEPFRATVIQRYLEGKTCAEIARAQGVPAGTVRWRLKEGLDRLRAALEDDDRRWRAVLLPLAGQGVIVKTKGSIIGIAFAILLLLAGGIALYKSRGGGGDDREAAPTAASGQPAGSAGIAIVRGSAAPDPEPAPVRDPLPGQGKAIVEPIALAGGAVSGRVINWSTGDGVANAELTFLGTDGGALTVRSRADGGFELAPAAPGRFKLAAIAAAGFLPYAPELLHSTVHVALTRERAVRGITVFLFPAVEYHGRVVDAANAPVAGAKVRLLGTPAGEQAIDKLATEWTTDNEGKFTFNAADDAVFEAVRGKQRGWARLAGDAQLTHQLVIKLGDAPARDAAISGRVVDAKGSPLADVLVRALPADEKDGDQAPPRAAAFATTSAEGTFELDGLDTGTYDVTARVDDRAPVNKLDVPGGTRDVVLTLDEGVVLAGRVRARSGEAVPAYTLLVSKQLGAIRALVLARSVVDANGRFEVRVAPGEYELIAAASGWARSEPVAATAGATDVTLEVTAGATLRGKVVSAASGAPLPYARVMREGRGGGSSAQPANAGTVTREDGTFELTGIPPGPVSISIAAGNHHPKIEAGMMATDGGQLGPLAIALRPLEPGEKPELELVGIGVKLAADGDALRVEQVWDGSGAAAAGIVAGDLVIAVDGLPVSKLGVDGAVGKIRGVEGTSVSITLRRDDQPVSLVVQRKKLRA